MAWSDDIGVKRAGVGAGLGGLAGLLFNRYALGNESAGSAAIASALGAALGGGGSAAYDYFAGPSVQKQTKNVDKRNEAKRLADMYLSNEGLTPKKGVKSKLTDENADAVIADLRSGIDDSFVSRQWPWLLLPGATRASTEVLGRTLVPPDSSNISITLPGGRTSTLKVTESRDPLSWLIGTPAKRRVDISKLSDEARVQLIRDMARGSQRVDLTPNQREELLRSLQRFEHTESTNEALRAAREVAADASESEFNKRMARYNKAVTENLSRKIRNRKLIANAKAEHRLQVEMINGLNRLLPKRLRVKPPKFQMPQLEHTLKHITKPTRGAARIAPAVVNVPVPALKSWGQAFSDAQLFNRNAGGFSRNAFRRLRLPGLLGLANVAAIGAAGLGAIGSEVARKQRLKDLASGIVNEN